MTSPANLCTTISTHLHITTLTTISLLPFGSEILSSPPHLGIPKRLLYTAFAHARTQPLLLPANPATARKLLETTLILLLGAAEHTTAINARRRLLILLAENVEAEWTLPNELVLLQSLLTSPLHKHTKSPTLWGHRQWVYEHLSPNSNECLVKELEGVVFKSELAHPRNYYAWSYARWAASYFTPFSSDDVVKKVAEFCWSQAPSCISPWMFLLHVLEGEGGKMVEEMVRETMRLGVGVLRGHESLWCFVRTVLAREKVLRGERRRVLVGVLEEWVREGEGEGKALGGKALKWIRKWGDGYSDGAEEALGI